MLDLSCLETQALAPQVCAQPAVHHTGGTAQFPLPQVQDVSPRLAFWDTSQVTGQRCTSPHDAARSGAEFCRALALCRWNPLSGR